MPKWKAAAQAPILRYGACVAPTGRIEKERIVANSRALLEKIQALPPERIAEIEDFVEFIASREQARSLARAASAASAPAFAAIWRNPDDDAYDAL